jgi:PPOX class probable F420-dependent enzyme
MTEDRPAVADPSPNELTPEDRALIHKKSFGHFTTLMPDGAPQTSPVWIDERDGLILVNSREGRLKTNNARRDPRVSISITDPENPYRMIAVCGRVVDVIRDGAEDHIDFLQEKYHGYRPYPDHDPEHPRVLIRIRPERIGRMGM